MGFVEDDDPAQALEALQKSWPEATLTENSKEVSPIVDHIFSRERTQKSKSFHLLLKGTNFQINVWRALLSIPRGRLVSYQDIAAYIGKPKAFRAAATAIAINPVGYMIPCHRVIAKTGRIHHYRWGSSRKKAILGWEATEEMGGFKAGV